MKKILLITHDFTPISNGTVTCLENLVPILSADFELTIATNKSTIFQKTKFHQDGLTLIRFGSVKQATRSLTKKISLFFSRSPLLRPIKIILSKKKRQMNHTQTSRLEDPLWVSQFTEFVANEIKLNPVDAVIAVGAPFDDFRVGVVLKKRFPKLQLILLQFDLYTHNPETMAATTSNEILLQNRLAQEKNWLTMADAVLVVEEMIGTMLTSELSFYKDKIVPFSLPGFLKQSVHPNQTDSSNQSINLIYTGAFYQDIRNPQKTLEILHRLVQKDHRIKIHLYSRGCDDIVEKYIKIIPDNLIYHGYQSRLKVSAAINVSDFLINIGNTTSNQVPSKILEYISTGKPIIHFYSIESDSCIAYLEGYPYALCLNEREDLNDLTQRLLEFVDTSQGAQASFDQLLARYERFTPKALGDKIKAIVHQQE